MKLDYHVELKLDQILVKKYQVKNGEQKWD